MTKFISNVYIYNICTAHKAMMSLGLEYKSLLNRFGEFPHATFSRFIYSSNGKMPKIWGYHYLIEILLIVCEKHNN